MSLSISNFVVSFWKLDIWIGGKFFINTLVDQKTCFGPRVDDRISLCASVVLPCVFLQQGLLCVFSFANIYSTIQLFGWRGFSFYFFFFTVRSTVSTFEYTAFNEVPMRLNEPRFKLVIQVTGERTVQLSYVTQTPKKFSSLAVGVSPV